MKECTNCKGEGGWYDGNDDWVLCGDCRGSGHIYDSDEIEDAGQLRFI